MQKIIMGKHMVMKGYDFPVIQFIQIKSSWPGVCGLTWEKKISSFPLTFPWKLPFPFIINMGKQPQKQKQYLWVYH